MNEKETDEEKIYSELRDLVNRVINDVMKELFDDRKEWFIITSSIDALGDTVLSIKSYETYQKIEGTVDLGKKYLLIYGLFQSMYVQQDAMNNIADCLKVPRLDKKKLKCIREIRNDVVGHPTIREHLNRTNMLYRDDLNLSSFHFLSSNFSKKSNPNEKEKSTEVKPFELIKEQRKIIMDYVRSINSSLKDRINKHREKFKNKKLSDCFTKDTDDLISKVIKIKTKVKKVSNSTEAKASFETLSKCVEKFKIGLKERKCENNEHIKFLLEKLKEASWILEDYFSNKKVIDNWDGLNIDDAIDCFGNTTKELKEIAIEIDNEYNTKI